MYPRIASGSLTYIWVALTYWFLIGAICPMIAYVIHLKWPRSFIRYVKWVFFCLGRLALD